MSHGIPIASLLLLVGASSATAQSLPLFLFAPALPVIDCGRLNTAFALPGSATCVRVGGSVWAGATLGRATPLAVSPVPPADRIVGPGRIALSPTRLKSRLSFDARTDTAYGPIRAYVSIRAH